MMVYALSDIKKGGEITIAYHNLKDSYSKRARHFQQSYGFTCDCALCEWERKDPKQEERNSLIDQCQKYIGMPCTNPDKVIAGVTPILEKVRLLVSQTLNRCRQNKEIVKVNEVFVIIKMNYLITK